MNFLQEYSKIIRLCSRKFCALGFSVILSSRAKFQGLNPKQKDLTIVTNVFVVAHVYVCVGVAAGLLHVIQVPRLNCLSCEVPDTKDLAFRLKRKQFTIEVFTQHVHTHKHTHI